MITILPTDFGHSFRVLSKHPENGSPSRWHRDVVHQLGHVDNDVLVVSGLRLKQLLDHHYGLGHNSLERKT